MDWNEAQEYERDWWLTAIDEHVWEQSKSDLVAGFIRLGSGRPTSTVIDIGSGPFSILQRVPVRSGTALDPLNFGPLEAGYLNHGIQRLIKRAEDLSSEDGHWDEAWIYNCLQHVDSPEKVLGSAQEVADLVRLFEWINVEPYQGHLHKITPELLHDSFQNWHAHLECTGKLNSSGLCGEFFVGIWEKETLSEGVI